MKLIVQQVFPSKSYLTKQIDFLLKNKKKYPNFFVPLLKYQSYETSAKL